MTMCVLSNGSVLLAIDSKTASESWKIRTSFYYYSQNHSAFHGKLTLFQTLNRFKAAKPAPNQSLCLIRLSRTGGGVFTLSVFGKWNQIHSYKIHYNWEKTCFQFNKGSYATIDQIMHTFQNLQICVCKKFSKFH